MENQTQNLSSSHTNNMPYVYIVLSNVGGSILSMSISALFVWLWESFDLSVYLSDLSYSHIHTLLINLPYVFLMLIGFVIIKDLKLFLFTLGCGAIVGKIIGIFSNLLLAVICSVFDLDTYIYSLIFTANNVITPIISTIITCLFYKILQDKTLQDKISKKKEDIQMNDNSNTNININAAANTSQTNSTLVMPTEKSPRSRLTAGLLCFFLGIFGIHRIYVGKIGTGILWMLTGGLFGIGELIDFFMIIFGAFKDAEGRTV